MRLGEMLVRDGRLAQDQLDAAIAYQRESGGRLGSVLVEMGLLDLGTLTAFLGVELSTPIATKAALEKAKQRAVRLLQPEAAANYLCVPLLIQDRQVIAAIADPHDIEALDDLLQLTGYRIVPRVAPEIRIHQYIEKYYGIAKPSRFAHLEDSASDGSPLARPLPGLPQRSENPIKPPSDVPALAVGFESASGVRSNIVAARTEAPEHDDSFDEIELEAADLLFELDNDEEDVAEPADGTFVCEQSATLVTPSPSHEEYLPVSVEETLASIEDASGRNDIAKSLIAYASGIFDVSALCIVRDNMAFGWKAHGNDLSRSRIETLLVPLDKPSIFHDAIHSRAHVFAGKPSNETLHKYLYKVLCCRAPQFAVVRAIVIGNRIVNVFYGHRSEDVDMSQEDLDGIAQVCGAARKAYVRMITST